METLREVRGGTRHADAHEAHGVVMQAARSRHGHVLVTIHERLGQERDIHQAVPCRSSTLALSHCMNESRCREIESHWT
jgi:hypothetical protein